MSFFLTHAFLLPFSILVAVPLVLHLFARTRPPVYNFSSVEFILRILRSTMRIKRPQDWLLLFLRTLLFAAVILLFLQPVLFHHGNRLNRFQKKNMVLIVDASASMAYIDGAQTRFAAACGEASEILSGLSAGDAANIIWMDASPQAVFPEMGVNVSYLQDALHRASVTMEAGDIEGALKQASHLLEGKKGAHEIYVISDFQKTAWKDADTAVPPDVQVIHVKIGSETAANTALTDIHCYPETPLVDEECSLYGDVYNYSDQTRRRTVFFSVAEDRQTRHVVIPAWSKVTVMFQHTFSSAGTFPVTLSLSEDTYTGDDQRWRKIHVRSSLQVGLWAGQSAMSDVWGRAVRAMGWAKVETLSSGDFASTMDMDVLMLAGWNGVGMAHVKKALENGCTVICDPPRDAKAAEIIAALRTRFREPTTMSAYWETLVKPRRIKVAKEDDHSFRLFAEGDHGDPARGRFKARFNVAADAFEGDDVLLRYDDGVPALVRFNGAGNLFFWNAPLDQALSDWAGHMEFLPFLAELILTSRSYPAREDSREEVFPGEGISRRLDESVQIADIRLLDRTGNELSIREAYEDRGRTVFSKDPPPIGLYTWNHMEQLLGYSIVNFPSIESDLRTLSLESIEKDGAVTVMTGSKIKTLREGTKLWPYMLGLALILAMLEGAVLLWVERT